jgi:hypothetical protein
VVVVFPGRIGIEAELEVAIEMDCLIVPVPIEEGDYPSRLLANRIVRERLQRAVPDYLGAAENHAVTPVLLKDCVGGLLSERPVSR